MQQVVSRPFIQDRVLFEFFLDINERSKSLRLESIDILSNLRTYFAKNNKISIEEKEAAIRLIEEARHSRDRAFFRFKFLSSDVNIIFPDFIGFLDSVLSSALTIQNTIQELILLRQRYVRRSGTLDLRLDHFYSQVQRFATDISLVSAAIDKKDPAAIEEIYRRFIGERLSQEAAPYLFDIINFIIGLHSGSGIAPRNRPVVDLINMVDRLILEAAKTNVDRRFIEALSRYKETLVNDFNPIRAELYSNILRSYLISLSNEIPNFVMADMTAILLTQDQIFSQFPEWREFKNRSEDTHPSQKLEPDQASLIDVFGSELSANPDLSTESARDAIIQIQGTKELSGLRPTGIYGIWKSAENLMKEAVRVAVNEIRSGIDHLRELKNERYFDFLERVLPHIKLVCSTRQDLVWLVPVIDWMQELLELRRRK